MQTNFETWNDLVHEQMHLSKLAGEQLEQSFADIVAFIQGRIELLERSRDCLATNEQQKRTISYD